MYRRGRFFPPIGYKFKFLSLYRLRLIHNKQKTTLFLIWKTEILSGNIVVWSRPLTDLAPFQHPNCVQELSTFLSNLKQMAFLRPRERLSETRSRSISNLMAIKDASTLYGLWGFVLVFAKFLTNWVYPVYFGDEYKNNGFRLLFWLFNYLHLRLYLFVMIAHTQCCLWLNGNAFSKSTAADSQIDTIPNQNRYRASSTRFGFAA